MRALILLGLAAALPALAQPVSVAPWMTGDRFLELAKWPPGAKDNFDLNPQQYRDQQMAKMYIHGVHDATEGKSWCYSLKYRPKPDVLEDDVIEGLKKLPAAQLQRSAADLFVEIWLRRWPCAPGAGHELGDDCPLFRIEAALSSEGDCQEAGALLEHRSPPKRYPMPTGITPALSG